MRATESDVDDDVDVGVEMEEGEIPMGIEQGRAGKNLKIFFLCSEIKKKIISQTNKGIYYLGAPFPGLEAQILASRPQS